MILITGGAGFIGSALVKELNDRGRTDIIIVDRLGQDDKWFNIRGLKYRDYVHADDLFLPELTHKFSNLEVIFHLGACSDTTEKDVDYLFKNNIEYSKKIFRLSAEKEIPFIYASSAATYGDGNLGYSDEENMIPKLKPLNPYGYSKQFFDEWMLRQKRFPKFWFGLKFFNVYGPNEYHKGHMRSVVKQAFEQIKAQGKVKLFRSERREYVDGGQKRDFIYVKDTTKAMLTLFEKALTSKEDFSGIYNLGTGMARSFNDLATATFHALDRSPQIEYFDMPDHLKDQYQYYTQAQMEKFHKILPEFKFTSLEEGVKDYVCSYLNKSNPYLEV